MFKHKLEHYHVEIPDGAWENIASRLPEPKRKYRPWWAFASILTVIAVAGISALFMANGNESNGTSAEDCENINNSITNNKEQPLIASNDVIEFNAPTTNLKSVSNEISSSPFTHTIKHTSTIYNTSSKAATRRNVINIPIDNIEIENNMVATLEKRDVAEVKYLETILKNAPITTSRKIKTKGIFAKEKVAKACPFVLDVQDKSVDVYFSNDFVSKSLTGSQDVSAYKDMRLATEEPLYSFSVGARFGYNISYRWNLHTGFNYSQINEKFEYVDPESNQTRIITIKDYVYDNGKIVDSIVTEQTVLVPGTTKHTVYNKYRTFDIPVLGRYTIFANKHLSLSGVAGVFINLSTQEKGMILAANNNKPISLSSLDDEGNTMFKTQLGLTGYGSLSLAYHITPNIDFLLEPNVRLQTESMTNDNYPLRQRFNTYGLSTGLRYKF
jgi:hypothetical protein